MIIHNKSNCLLCQQILNKDDKVSGFPAFLPPDHKYGRFADSAFHKDCFAKDPDHQAVEDMFAAYEMVMHSQPSDLKSMEEINAWTRDAFKDWPPKNGVVIFQPMFSEDSEEEGFWMDADQYKDMCEAEDEHDKRQKELREYYHKLDMEALQYTRDDD